METEKICQYCGKKLITNNLNAKFCSTSCRVQNYKKLKTKKDVYRTKSIKILLLISIILFSLNLIFYTIPEIINSYKNYKIESQNKELEQFKKRNLHDNYFDVKEENENLKYCLDAVLDYKNKWLTKSDIKQFKELFKKELNFKN